MSSSVQAGAQDPRSTPSPSHGASVPRGARQPPTDCPTSTCSCLELLFPWAPYCIECERKLIPWISTAMATCALNVPASLLAPGFSPHVPICPIPFGSRQLDSFEGVTLPPRLFWVARQLKLLHPMLIRHPKACRLWGVIFLVQVPPPAAALACPPQTRPELQHPRRRSS